MNENLEKDNVKHLKKIKKFTTQVDKLTTKSDSLESTLKTLQEKQTIDEQSLKVAIDYFSLEDNFNGFYLQDKDAMISELNKELLTLKEEMKETNHNNQVMEKRLLKTQDDYETMKSKFETFKDIEIVNCTIMCHNGNLNFIMFVLYRLCASPRKKRDLRTRKRSGNCAKAEWTY